MRNHCPHFGSWNVGKVTVLVVSKKDRGKNLIILVVELVLLVHRRKSWAGEVLDDPVISYNGCQLIGTHAISGIDSQRSRRVRQSQRR